MLSGNHIIYNITDLESCYARQLAEIRSIIQELVGIERLPIKLFMKMIPVMEDHICIGYRISKEWYRGINKRMAGTGQRNVILGNICRDTLYIIFKAIKNNKVGIIVKVLITKD